MTSAEEEVLEGAEKEGLEGIFTRYVRALATREAVLSPGTLFEEVWEKLRKVVRRDLERRSLWSSSPSYLGLQGWASWTPAPGGEGPSSGPLDELLPDCYTWIFHRQLTNLMSQLKVRSSVDQLVVVQVRNFLTERQKTHDPLGYRLFEILKEAVLSAVEHEEIYVLRGSRKIRNHTVLAAFPEADPESAVSVADLRPIVERWNDDLLPDLVTAGGGAQRRRLVERLRSRLFDLESLGVAVFGFKDLLDPMKHDVRSRWAALFDLEEGEAVTVTDEDTRRVVRLFRPEDRLEKLDGFQKLVACVADLIDREVPRRRRRYLEHLWGFLRRFAVDEAADRPASRRKQAMLLKIPRDRLPGLYDKLGELVRRCQEVLASEQERRRGEVDG